MIPWPHRSPLLDAIGGLEYDPAQPTRLGFRVEGAKLNRRGFLHGGAISSIADVVLGYGLATLTDPPTDLITINLSCDYLGAAREGEWVDITVSPTRLGRRLAAATAVFATDRPIATVSGLFMPA